jgi:hypothetical protein
MEAWKCNRKKGEPKGTMVYEGGTSEELSGELSNRLRDKYRNDNMNRQRSTRYICITPIQKRPEATSQC